MFRKKHPPFVGRVKHDNKYPFYYVGFTPDLLFPSPLCGRGEGEGARRLPFVGQALPDNVSQETSSVLPFVKNEVIAEGWRPAEPAPQCLYAGVRESST